MCGTTGRGGKKHSVVHLATSNGRNGGHGGNERNESTHRLGHIPLPQYATLIMNTITHSCVVRRGLRIEQHKNSQNVAVILMDTFALKAEG